MARFEKGDRIAQVRKVKESGRIVETLKTGTITGDCFYEENLEHYFVDWDNQPENDITVGLFNLPKFGSKPKYDYIKLTK
jgi:hypothetical protein